ncbi:MAG: (Fe-S)-binding protein [Desulfosarcina sp.]|nr:(Fe-S)-binding protein [Desulfosarcina sp.]MBC2766050.1 (Fe-S)-binding protein [Desulfosarcina sp.]
MAEPLKKEKTKVVDEGIDVGISRLTEEKIESVINTVLETETGARLKIYVETCIHCGLCSEACHYYLSHDKDPHYSPVGKIKQTIWEMIKKRGRVSPEFIRRAAIIAQTECNSHSVTMNQMWVKGDEWPDTLQWQEEEAQAEIPDLRIPLEKEGADIMYSVIAPEPKFQAQLIYQAAVIMHVAGVNWTMPASVGWDNSDMAMFTGDNEVMGRLKRAHFETAARLKVKKIVMGECGHAFRSVYDMGNRWLGWSMPPFTIVHAIEFYYDLIKDGRIKIAKKYKPPITLHDPCNVVRGGGLHEKARYVAHALCETVIEMHPNREHNYCCCAGGGVINTGPPFKMTRILGNRVKAEQLFETKTKGAEVLVAPCHNCHSGLHDIVHHYEIGLDIKFFGDIIYEVMEKPE